MFRTLSSPILVQWEVTPTCNHNCIHCYNFWRVGSPPPKLPDNYTDLFSKITEEIVSNKIFFVVITGGEPLIVLKEVAPYIKRLSSSGVGVSLNSNLTLLTPELANILTDIGVKSILTSLPSADEKNCDAITSRSGSLSKIVSGIEMAVSFGFQVSANMVVSKTNAKDLEKTAKLAKSIGIRHFSATRASNPIPSGPFLEQTLNLFEFRAMQEEISVLRSKYPFSFTSLEAVSLCSLGDSYVDHNTRSCTAGKTSCAIGVDGNVRACIRLEKSYGNIFGSLNQAWMSMTEARDGSWIPDSCLSCKHKVRCGGGCKADAIISSGSIKNPDPLCDFDNIPGKIFSEYPIVKKNSFVVSPRIKIRKEAFGTIIVFNSSNWVIVSHELASVLRPGNEISISEISNTLGNSEEEAIKTASYLVYKKVLK